MAGRRRRQQSRAPETETSWGIARVTAVKTRRQPGARAGACTRIGPRTRARPPARAQRPWRCRPPRRCWSRPGCERRRCSAAHAALRVSASRHHGALLRWLEERLAAAKSPSPWSSSGAAEARGAGFSGERSEEVRTD